MHSFRKSCPYDLIRSHLSNRVCLQRSSYATCHIPHHPHLLHNLFPSLQNNHISYHQPLNLILQRADLSHQITTLIRSDTGRNDCSRDSRRTTQCDFAGNVHVGNVFVFAEEREVEEDGEGGGVGCEDEDFGGAAVEGFCCWVEDVG